MTAQHQEASFWGQLPGNEDSMKGKGVADLERAYKFIIKGTARSDWQGSSLTWKQISRRPPGGGVASVALPASAPVLSA